MLETSLKVCESGAMDALLLAKNVWKKKYGDGTRGEEEFGRGRNQKVYDDFFFQSK